MTEHHSGSIFSPRIVLSVLLTFFLVSAMGQAEPVATATPQPRRAHPSILKRVFPRSNIHERQARPQAASPRKEISPPAAHSEHAVVKRAVVRPPAARTERRKPSYAMVAKPSEQVTSGPKAISRWPTGQKLVALTYDDGPNPQITPRLLALLREKQVRATFFLLGDSVRAYPSLVEQIADAGMEIGNHSDTHPQFTKLSEQAIRDQLERNQQRILSAAPGVAVRVMRPPYGAYNSQVLRIAEQMGYKVILWDVDTNDWRRRTSQQMIATIMSSARDGSIILMHDRYETTLETTAAVIDGLRAQGFRFVTVSEMLDQPRQTPPQP